MHKLQRLHSVHREIIRMHVLGYSNMAIANELGMTPPGVRIALESDLAKIAIEDMQKELDREVLDVGKQLAENSKTAEQFLGQIVNGRVEGASTALRARVCMDQLDRSGYAKVTRNINVDLHGELTQEEIDGIKERARSLKHMVPAHVVEDEESEVGDDDSG